MIKTLRNVVTTVVSQNYDPEWTYIEALIKGNKKTTTYTFYRRSNDSKYISELFEEYDIVVDWGDGTINNQSTHKYFSDKSGKDTRVVIKIKNIYNALEYYRNDDMDKSLEGFLDQANTVGALSIAKPNNDAREQLSLRALFKNCPVDNIDSRCFNNCSDIWDFSEIFQSTKISRIPENLFQPCTGATYVSYAFAFNPNLKDFPITIFDTCKQIQFTLCLKSVFETTRNSDLFKFEVETLKNWDNNITNKIVPVGSLRVDDVNGELAVFFIERIDPGA